LHHKTPSQTEKNYYNFFAAANINPEKKKRVNRVKQNRVDYCSRTPNESEQQIQQTNEQRKKEHKIKIQFRIYYLFVALQENKNDIGFVSCCNKRKTIKSFQRRFEKVQSSQYRNLYLYNDFCKV
jgi:hypothetical protein